MPTRPARCTTLTLRIACALLTGLPVAFAGEPEKEELTLGFIKLTDSAPLVIAYEKGYFEDEGLYVTLEVQANWKVLLDRVIDGALDGAHMLGPQPLGARTGIGTQADLVVPISLGLNGNAITVSNAVWQQMRPHVGSDTDGRPLRPVSARALKPVVEAHTAKGQPFRMGIVFPLSTHNYELRYWLAAGGLSPGFYSQTDVTGTTDADVILSVTPPPQMPATLEAGTIHGYCVGEPWNQQAVFKGVGVPVITDYEIWQNNPEKVFGLTEDFVRKYPNTTEGIVKALIRAGQWLDAGDGANRAEAARILARPEYVGADEEVIAASMTGTFEYEKGERRSLPDFNVFYRHHATFPWYSDAVWFLTQMRRWGQIGEAKPDAWYAATAAQVYRPDIYRQAAASLVAAGQMSAADLPDGDGYRPPTDAFIDAIRYDGRQPNAYLAQFPIGLQGRGTP